MSRDSPEAPPFFSVEAQVFDAQGLFDVLTQPVFASGIKLDDLYEDVNTTGVAKTAPLGQVVVKFSREAVAAKQRDILWLGGLITALGLLFGLGLAVRLSEGVIRQMMRL